MSKRIFDLGSTGAGPLYSLANAAQKLGSAMAEIGSVLTGALATRRDVVDALEVERVNRETITKALSVPAEMIEYNETTSELDFHGFSDDYPRISEHADAVFRQMEARLREQLQLGEQLMGSFETPNERRALDAFARSRSDEQMHDDIARFERRSAERAKLMPSAEPDAGRGIALGGLAKAVKK